MTNQRIKLEWHGEKVNKRIRDEALARVTMASEHLRTKILEKLSGSRSGRVYRIPGTGRTYVASAPGEAPAVRLGGLRRSIRVQVQRKRGEVLGEVGTDLDYGLFLERGTRKMSPRPWLKKTYDEEKQALEEIIGDKWTL